MRLVAIAPLCVVAVAGCTGFIALPKSTPESMGEDGASSANGDGPDAARGAPQADAGSASSTEPVSPPPMVVDASAPLVVDGFAPLPIPQPAPEAGPAIAVDAGDVTCWSPGPAKDLLPRLPAESQAVACSKPPPAAWSVAADVEANLVGRWASCGAVVLGGAQAAGLEVGGNLRWRVLGLDASGQLVPRPDLGIGRLQVLPQTAQVNFELETTAAGGVYPTFAGFTADGSTMSLVDSAGSPASDARVDAAPNNGDDNPPPTFDGRCSLVGTWDYAASAGAMGSLSFDPYGNWVGGGVGADLCAGHTMDGTYVLRPGSMEFVTVDDHGICAPEWGMGKVPTFDADCTHVTLAEAYDNCTGARSEFNYDLALTKR
jgi:hypothetical protein